MVRRSLGVALWMIVGLLACFLGALSALVGTGAGRGLLARVTESALTHVFTGSIEVGDVRGSLLTGVTLTGVRLLDADTTLVAWLPRADLTYNPFDFAAGRVVLFEFALRQPVINIVQHRNGRLNIEELLRLGGPDTGAGTHGPATLILFRNVRIEDGTVTLRLQAARPEPGDTALEIQGGGPNGRQRIRRFQHLDARLAALQVSSPTQRGIGIDVTRLAVESSDPALRLVDVAGRLRVVGDSLELDLSRVGFPRSQLRTARGRVSWPHDTLLFDLSLRADSATLSDFHFIDRRFAPGAVLAGGVRLRSHGGRVLEVGLNPLRLSQGGGTVTGRLTALSAADSGLVALRDAELDAQDFDLEFARPFLDTLPFAGWLTGHTTATGPVSALTLDIDWTFRDSLVPGRPETRIRGRGDVALGAARGVRGSEGRLAGVRRSQGELPRAAAARRGGGSGKARRAAHRARDPRGAAFGWRRSAGRRRLAAGRGGIAHRRPRLRAAGARSGSGALARPGTRVPALVQRGRQRGGGGGNASRGVAPRAGRPLAVRRHPARLGGRGRPVRRAPPLRRLAAPRAARLDHHGLGRAGLGARRPRHAGARLQRRQPELARLAAELGHRGRKRQARGRRPSRPRRPAPYRRGAPARQPRGLARLAPARGPRQRRAAAVAQLGGAAGARAVRLSAGPGAGVRAGGDARFPGARRPRFRRRRRVGARHARLAHLVRALQGRGGRRLPRGRSLRAARG